MAKGPLVTDAVEATIAEVYQKHPKWKAPEIRFEVNYLLRQKNPKLPAAWPGLSTVQKVLATIRRKEKEPLPNPLDKPWSIGTLVKHPIPPEALPTVLEVWAKFRKSEIFFSVRVALWFSRLSSVLSDFEKVGDKNRNLANVVIWYAIREGAYDVIGKDIVDTSDLDEMVLQLLKLEEDKEEDKRLPLIIEGGYIK
ncbi:hypothetical protein ACFLVX_04395 [Chloroflexota bacterium]